MAEEVTQSPDQYFASVSPDKLAGLCDAKATAYWQYLSATGLLSLYRRVYYAYYKADTNNGAILKAGMNGEYTILTLNHFKNLLDHLHSLITSQKFSYQPKAANTDFKSQSAAILSKGLLEYFDNDTDKRVNKKRKRATRFALMFGEGWVTLDWDANVGEDKGVLPGGQIRKAGDFNLKVFMPTDVIRDVTRRDMDGDWVITREYRNKWDLAANYPEKHAEIVAIQSEPDDETNLRLMNEPDFTKSDLIPVYTFRHAKTPSMPEGRYFVYLNADTYLLDSALPYKTTHVYNVTVEAKEDTAFGYTHLFHLLPLQEQLDNLFSVVATNQSLGVTNILIPEGSNMQVEQLAEGMNAFKYNPMNGAKPESLNLVNTPKEIFTMIESLIQNMETLSGVNSVIRGEVPTNLRSGSALALVASQAIQFSSGLQESYANLVADTATGIVQLLQDFPMDARVALIAGKVNQPLLKEFKSDDLGPIQRVQIELANPLASTTAGRVQLAETLISNGLVKDPQKYLMVLQTGTLEPEIEGLQAEMLLIKQENEALSQGQPCMAVKTDNHPLHVSEHKAVLSSLQARQDPAIVQVTLTHIQEHIQLMMQMQVMEPMLLQMLGIPPMAMPMAPEGGDGSSPEIEPPAAQGGSPTDKPAPANMPSMPAAAPEASQTAYDQMAGPATNPTNNARANA